MKETRSEVGSASDVEAVTAAAMESQKEELPSIVNMEDLAPYKPDKNKLPREHRKPMTRLLIKNFGDNKEYESLIKKELEYTLEEEQEQESIVSYTMAEKNFFGSGYELWRGEIFYGTGRSYFGFIYDGKKRAYITYENEDVIHGKIRPFVDINNKKACLKYATFLIGNCYHVMETVEKIKSLKYVKKNKKLASGEKRSWENTDLRVNAKMRKFIPNDFFLYFDAKLSISKDKLEYQNNIKMRLREMDSQANQ